MWTALLHIIYHFIWHFNHKTMRIIRVKAKRKRNKNYLQKRSHNQVNPPCLQAQSKPKWLCSNTFIFADHVCEEESSSIKEFVIFILDCIFKCIFLLLLNFPLFFLEACFIAVCVNETWNRRRLLTPKTLGCSLSYLTIASSLSSSLSIKMSVSVSVCVCCSEKKIRINLVYMFIISWVHFVSVQVQCKKKWRWAADAVWSNMWTHFSSL